MVIFNKKSQGFSLIELMISIGVMGILLAIGGGIWSSFAAQKGVEGAATNLVSVFETARMNAISSKNAQAYGVNVASTSVVLFGGATFNSNDPSNEKSNIEGAVVATSTLTGGTSNIIFSRFAGTPSATGTLYLISPRDSSVVKVIEINDAGLAKIL